jgi:predicted adenine nucleotide alpha hydrolase (AANH) superfamily ATPase
MKLLMHICCANCALFPLKNLKERGARVQGLWFNPNIHPYTEYRSRHDALRQLEELWRLDIHYDDQYGLRDFVRGVAHREHERCEHCYSIRLEEAARRARGLGMDAFSTTLLVSPYQRFDLIVKKGREFEEKYDVEFLAEDFRPGWNEGRKLSKEIGLYRQKYCGCVYSEMERYIGDGALKEKEHQTTSHLPRALS